MGVLVGLGFVVLLVGFVCLLLVQWVERTPAGRRWRADSLRRVNASRVARGLEPFEASRL